MELRKASLEPPDGLLEFLTELGEGEGGFGGSGLFGFKPNRETLEEYLARLVELEVRRDLLSGYVPMTTSWLLNDDGHVVGMSRLRHYLNEDLLIHGGHIGYYVRPAERRKGYGTLILKLTLELAAARGIELCLLTVDRDNIASRRVITANGGVLSDERVGEDGRPFCRYWVRASGEIWPEQTLGLFRR